MVIILKVVGLVEKKLSRNFIFENSTVIFTGYLPGRRLFFSDFDIIFFSQTKIRVMLYIVSRGGPSGKLSIAGLRSKKFAQEVPRL